MIKPLHMWLSATLFFITSHALTIEAQSIIHAEDFSSLTSGSWTAVNVVGPTDVWKFATGTAVMNGFGDEDDEDWLISPPLNLNNSTAETFGFTYRDRFAGGNIALLYTTNYSGDPTTTTWADVPLTLTNNNTNTVGAFINYTPLIDISNVVGTNVRIAFKYTGTAILTKEWSIDDIQIKGNLPCNAPLTQTTALNATPSNVTANIAWTKGDGTNTYVLINNVNTFTPPVDGTTYTASTAYSGTGQQVIYVGSNASVNITGLTANTRYYIQAYNFNNCGLPLDYVTNAPATGNFTTTNTSSGGGEPIGYYNATGTLTCQPLRNALTLIIKQGHVPLSYTPGVWNAYPLTDKKRNDANTADVVWDMYSDNPTGPDPYTFTFVTDQDNGTGGTAEGQKFNREHSFPKSWFANGDTMITDIFHVIPTDKHVNGIRGNYPYGETNTPVFTSLNGSKFGISALQGIGGSVFEPINAYKGDMARTYFYMATRYGHKIGSWKPNDQSAAVVLDGSNYPVFNLPYLSMLYKWHLQDPVSQKELDRNNAVYNIQRTRNPYIDHPEWVLKAFITGCGTITVPTVEANNTFSLKMYPNPTNDVVNVEVKTTEATALTLNITDVAGKILIEKKCNIAFGGITEQINISTLAKGLYFLIVYDGLHKKVQKLIVE